MLVASACASMHALGQRAIDLRTRDRRSDLRRARHVGDEHAIDPRIVAVRFRQAAESPACSTALVARTARDDDRRGCADAGWLRADAARRHRRTRDRACAPVQCAGRRRAHRAPNAAAISASAGCPGCDEFVRELIGIDQRNAESREARRHRAFSGRDAAGQRDSEMRGCVHADAEAHADTADHSPRPADEPHPAGGRDERAERDRRRAILAAHRQEGAADDRADQRGQTARSAAVSRRPSTRRARRAA